MTEGRILADIGHILNRSNILINPQFEINQREWSSGGNLASIGDYFVDRWCAAIANTAPTLVGDILTIAAGDAIKQIVEDVNIPNGDYTISWEGTAQVSIDGGADQSSPYSFTVSSGTDVEIEFGPGTVQQPMLVQGDFPLPFIRKQYGEELALCQRYYCKKMDVGATGYADSSGQTSRCLATGVWPVTMRTTPTLITANYSAGNVGTITSGLDNISDIGYEISPASSASGSTYFRVDITADAEL